MNSIRFAICMVLVTPILAGPGSENGAIAAPRGYYVTDLGALGGTDSYAWSMNAVGQVVGYAATEDEATINAFLWTPTVPNGTVGAMKDLGTLGGTYAWGVGINVHGQVAGVSATDDDVAEHATLWIPTTPNGTTGTLHDLETLGGTYGQANSINASGLVAGGSDVTDDLGTRAFLWKPDQPGGATGMMHDLGTVGGTNSFAWDMNASGQVTGDSDTTDDAETHAFLWIPTTPGDVTGVMHDLGTLGGATSFGSGINDLGDVAGSSLTTGDAAYHAFLWQPTTPGGDTGTMHDLGTLGGLNSYSYAVNSNEEVVGSSEVDAMVSNNMHAFLYNSDDGMIDLNHYIDPLLGWELIDAGDINDLGQIAGQGLINDEYHAYLLTPVLLGDANYDGSVDIFDVNTVSDHWGTEGPAGDVNGDGTVDIFDVNVISDNWGATLAGAQPVPEPSTLVLALAGLLSVLFRRKWLAAVTARR